MSKRVRNRSIIDNWKSGESARNHRGSFSTDGKRLWSYELQIGDTCPDTNAKVLRDYTANGRWGFRSQTTSCHVGLARVIADIID
tara:strand:+ start:1314 stop:1568 length:255 start_codon:yes stop_codon:yes gene_type:complete